MLSANGTEVVPRDDPKVPIQRSCELGYGGSMMSTALADPAVMIKQGAPHVIHSDEELAEYTKALFELTKKPDPTPEEEDAIELLTLLIERYETEHYPVPGADPVDVLKFLLDQNGLS